MSIRGWSSRSSTYPSIDQSAGSEENPGGGVREGSGVATVLLAEGGGGEAGAQQTGASCTSSLLLSQVQVIQPGPALHLAVDQH